MQATGALVSGLLTGRRARQVAAAWEARHEREGAAVYEMLLDLGVKNNLKACRAWRPGATLCQPGCVSAGAQRRQKGAAGGALVSQLLTGQRMRQVAAAWEARHEREGAAVYEMLLDLGGMYVKSAQILASKGDFVPEPWVGARPAVVQHEEYESKCKLLPIAQKQDEYVNCVFPITFYNIRSEEQRLV